MAAKKRRRKGKGHYDITKFGHGMPLKKVGKRRMRWTRQLCIKLSKAHVDLLKEIDPCLSQAIRRLIVDYRKRKMAKNVQEIDLEVVKRPEPATEDTASRDARGMAFGAPEDDRL